MRQNMRISYSPLLPLMLSVQMALSGCKTSQTTESLSEKSGQGSAQADLPNAVPPEIGASSNESRSPSDVSPEHPENAKSEEDGATELIGQVRAELRSLNTKLRDFYNMAADDPAIQRLRQNGTDEEYYDKLYEMAKQSEQSGQYAGVTVLLEKKQALVERLEKAEQMKRDIQKSTLDSGGNSQRPAARVVRKQRARTYKPSSVAKAEESGKDEKSVHFQRSRPSIALRYIAPSERWPQLPSQGEPSARSSESIASSHGPRVSREGRSLNLGATSPRSSLGPYRIGANFDSSASTPSRRQTRIIRKISGRRIGSRRVTGSSLGVPASKVFVRPVETRRQVVITEGEKESSLSDKAFSGSSPFVRPASSRVVVTEDWDDQGKGEQAKPPSVGPGRAFRVNPFGANAFGGIDEGNARPSSKSVIQQNIQLRKELERREKELKEREKRLEEERRRGNRVNIDSVRNRGRSRGRRF